LVPRAGGASPERNSILRKTILSGVLGLALTAVAGGCGGLGDYDDYDGRHDHSYGDYRDHRGDWRDHDRSSDYGDTQGRRNTRISDKLDDGRINGSARSYEERKASRAADEGVPGAARREAELRRDRLDRD
jgi:hypothetical protein